MVFGIFGVHTEQNKGLFLWMDEENDDNCDDDFRNEDKVFLPTRLSYLGGVGRRA